MASGTIKVLGPPGAGLVGGEPPLTPRVDFRDEDFRRLIDAQGVRFAWARAIRCPCRPVNDQTGQSDPNCPRCKDHPGWDFYGPDGYVIPKDAGQLDSVQQAVIAHYGASVISGVLINAGQRDEPNGIIGPWRFGVGTVTVRPENILSFNDRLVDLDSEMIHTEVVIVKWTEGLKPKPLPLSVKYTPIGINHVLTEDGTQLKMNVDFVLSDDGVITFRPNHAPPVGTRIGINYLCHTHWRVTGQPKAFRRTKQLLRNPFPTTPLGTPTALAIQAQVMLDYLADEK